MNARRFPNYEAIPSSAAYIGSTEGPDQISEETADRIDEAGEPVFFQDEDGHKHFFDLQPAR